MTTEQLRERWGDSLLTVLTGLLLVMMFVVAPLQALGLFEFQVFELLLAIFLVGGVFVMSGSAIAFTISACSRPITSFGAPAGVSTPHHD
ncbi:MAG: hypothetical protein ACK47P_10530, partial [Bradyrhizobium sp.]